MAYVIIVTVNNFVQGKLNTFSNFILCMGSFEICLVWLKNMVRKRVIDSIKYENTTLHTLNVDLYGTVVVNWLCWPGWTGAIECILYLMCVRLVERICVY